MFGWCTEVVVNIFFQIKFAPVDNYFLLLSFAQKGQLRPCNPKKTPRTVPRIGSNVEFHLYSNTLANR